MEQSSLLRVPKTTDSVEKVRKSRTEVLITLDSPS
jgi:hypothetical protein